MLNPESPEEMERLRVLRQAIAEKRKRTADGKFVTKEQTAQPVQPTEAAPTSNPLLSVSKAPAPVKGDPPLFNASVKITNPITYLKNWVRKIIGNEAITIKVKTVTALGVALILATGGISLTLLNLLRSTAPVVQYIPAFAASPTPDPWVEGAYSGKLETNSNGTFYLITNLDSVIKLEIPANVSLTKFIGKRILATGRYNKTTGILYVTDAKDLEVLPTQMQAVPTISSNPLP